MSEQENALPCLDSTLVEAPGHDAGALTSGVADPDATERAEGSEPGDSEGGSGQTANVHHATANEINFIANQVNNLVDTSARVSIRRFSAGDGVHVSDIAEQESALRFVRNEDEMGALLLHLSERRVLLLRAPRGACKGTAATCLATELRRRAGCRHPTLLVDSVDRRVQVNVREMAFKDSAVEDRVVIFRNAFARGNTSLVSFFQRTDRTGWNQLADRLRERNAFLLFTASPVETAPFDDHPPVAGLRRDLAPHPPEVRTAAFAARLEKLEQRGQAEARVLQMLRENGERLVDQFEFTARLGEFMDFCVDLNQPALDLDDALHRFQDTSQRLLHELDGDPESWSFGFTLALAQCARNANGVPWVEFDRLHRHVRQWLRRDLPAAAAGAQWDPADTADVSLELSDDLLLKRCHAEVVKDPVSLEDVVRFRGGDSPQQVWEAMLQRHRRVLTAILPGLQDLAQRDPSFGREGILLRPLQRLAAQVLGRIGEIDPRRIVLPLISAWAASGKPAHAGALGPLFHGVLGSGDTRYHRCCLDHLTTLQRMDTASFELEEFDDEASATGIDAVSRAACANGDETRFRISASEGDNQQMLTVVTAYSWIGDYELAVAMRELGAIARAHLLPMIKPMQETERLYLNVKSDLGKSRSAKARAMVASCTALRSFTRDTYAGEMRVLMGIEGSIASLCITTGPALVFREMSKWIASGGWKAGVLVGMMLLSRGGIADQLGRYGIAGAQTDAPAGVAYNPLVVALAASDDEVRQSARFLGDIFESLATPFAVAPTLQRQCRAGLVEHLLSWVRGAAPVPDHARAMQRFLEALARTHGGVLREPVLQLLRNKEFTSADPVMRGFAAGLEFGDPEESELLLTA